MTEPTYLSQAAYERLQEELTEREGPKRKEISDKIQAAREEGDLKENGGYHAAKEDQGHNEARIRLLKHLLETAKIGRPEDAAEGEATYGTMVTIRFEGESETERYLLASREEAAHVTDVEVISPSSPLGGALLGAQEGTSVSYSLPNGRTTQVEVVDVKPR
jgi:transcription elongation factor GreA